MYKRMMVVIRVIIIVISLVSSHFNTSLHVHSLNSVNVQIKTYVHNYLQFLAECVQVHTSVYVHTQLQFFMLDQ